jgi:hypothetical protein
MDLKGIDASYSGSVNKELGNQRDTIADYADLKDCGEVLVIHAIKSA